MRVQRRHRALARKIRGQVQLQIQIPTETRILASAKIQVPVPSHGRIQLQTEIHTGLQIEAQTRYNSRERYFTLTIKDTSPVTDTSALSVAQAAADTASDTRRAGVRMPVISLWLSLAHPHGTAQTPVQQLGLVKTDFAKLRQVVTAHGLALGLDSNAWNSDGFQTCLKLCHVPSESDSRLSVIIPTKPSVTSSQSLRGLVSSSSRAKGQSSHIH